MGRRGSRTRLRQLTVEEVATLERIRDSGRERMDRIRRADVVLTAHQGWSTSVVAGCTGYSSRGVDYLVARFNAVGLAALDVAAGRGGKRYERRVHARERRHQRRLGGSGATAELANLIAA